MLLLDLMSEGPAYRPLSDLAAASGLTLPTVHRLLRSLVLARMVEQEARTSRYGLGPELTRLSQRYLARLPILGALSPYLVPLRDHISATVHIAVLVRGSVVYVDQVDSDDSGLYRQSRHTEPALSTPAGRVLASRADEDEWDLALDRADEADRKAAEHEKENWSVAPYLARALPLSTSAQEIAVPVFDGSGHAAAALAASLPPDADQSRIDEIVVYLKNSASAAGRTLGHG